MRLLPRVSLFAKDSTQPNVCTRKRYRLPFHPSIALSKHKLYYFIRRKSTQIICFSATILNSSVELEGSVVRVSPQLSPSWIMRGDDFCGQCFRKKDMPNVHASNRLSRNCCSVTFAVDSDWSWRCSDFKMDHPSYSTFISQTHSTLITQSLTSQECQINVIKLSMFRPFTIITFIIIIHNTIKNAGPPFRVLPPPQVWIHWSKQLAHL